MKEIFKRALLKKQPKKKNFTREEQKEKEKKNYRKMKGRNIEKRKMEQALEKLKEETRPIVYKEDQENQEGNKRRKIGEQKIKWTQKKREKGEIKLILNK